MLSVESLEENEKPPRETPRQGRSLLPRLQDILSQRQGSLPVWVRAPAQGYEYYSGLSRAKLYELAKMGLIKTASLRAAGQLKAVRLFHLGSILHYIEQHVVINSTSEAAESASACQVADLNPD